MGQRRYYLYDSAVTRLVAMRNLPRSSILCWIPNYPFPFLSILNIFSSPFILSFICILRILSCGQTNVSCWSVVSLSVGYVYCLDAVMWVMFTDAVMPPSTFRCNASLIRYREIGCQPSLRTQKMNLIQKQ